MGAKVYWDDTNKRCTTVATDNTLIGVAVEGGGERRGRYHRPGAPERGVLMSAFAAAVGALFADPNIGRDAVYIADGGAPVLVRVPSPGVRMPSPTSATRGSGRRPPGSIYAWPRW